ncbi:MAG: HAMP domain-containing protein [Tepidisphaera sp.]|nr:HAMP domain-containing protein [Tepidisphaera sp.]
MKIKSKLVTLFLTMGVVPALAVASLAWFATAKIQDSAGVRFESVSRALLDKIDRNLFERYGDVQAFGVNTIVFDKANWYKPGGPISDTQNQYAALYGIYDITLFVDTEGKVISVNTKDPAGNPVDTSSIYSMNFADSAWFRDAMAGRFLATKDLTGTVVEDVYADPLVQKLYKNNGLTVGFSAPVKDAQGKTIGVWKNFARFSLIEDMVMAEYNSLKTEHMASAEMTLLDSKGRVIVDCDPSQHDGKLVRDTDNVILKLNLADSGVTAAKLAMDGEAGFNRSLHARKNIWQTCGYAHSQGALGYAGLNWSLLVRVPESETAAVVTQIREQVAGVVGVCTLGVGIAAWFVARSLVKPINLLRDRVSDIAQGEGDLTQRLELNSSDELGELSQGFNMFVDKLQGTIKDVATTAQQVAAASTQIAASAEEMAAGLQQQEGQTTQVAAAIEEMNASVQEVAQKGQDAAGAAKASQDDAITGGQVVTQTVDEMRGISDEVERSAQAVASLGKKSEQIGQIIEVINDIAEQTNLLALNAAIEAARAGEHGRGFAVVADEVRKLAERTTKATEEVATSIKEIQADTGTAVKQMEAGSARVHKGVELANSAGNALGRITQSSQGLTGMVQSIAAAAEQQSSTSQQIAKNIAQINAVTRESADGASQAAKAAALLSEQSERLQSLVRTFKV